MEWIKLTIFTTQSGIEPVLGILLDFGITSTQVSDENDFNDFLEENRSAWDYVDEKLVAEMSKESHVDFYIKPEEQEIVSGIRQELVRLKKTDLKGDFGRLSIEAESLFDEDWQNSWKKYFHTFQIGDKLVIKPYWEDTEADGKVIFEINPGLSFGTGTHHTTKMCLEDIVDTINGGEAVLDLGAGSGILSIVSMLFGAKRAVAVDIDENSQKTIAENLDRNGIDSSKYTIFIGNVLENEQTRTEILKMQYDIVFANIVADVVIALLPFVKKAVKENGIFIASGIIEDRYEEVKEKIIACGFKIISEKRSADWAEFKCSL